MIRLTESEHAAMKARIAELEAVVAKTTGLIEACRIDFRQGVLPNTRIVTALTALDAKPEPEERKI